VTPYTPGKGEVKPSLQIMMRLLVLGGIDVATDQGKRLKCFVQDRENILMLMEQAKAKIENPVRRDGKPVKEATFKGYKRRLKNLEETLVQYDETIRMLREQTTPRMRLVKGGRP
jgi:hypothetical protein